MVQIEESSDKELDTQAGRPQVQHLAVVAAHRDLVAGASEFVDSCGRTEKGHGHTVVFDLV